VRSTGCGTAERIIASWPNGSGRSHENAVPNPQRELLVLARRYELRAEQFQLRTPRARRQVGNFPQAFSHVALINTAHNLTRAYGPAQHRAESEETVGSDASRPTC
jgi:hypothetical protein